MDMEDTKFIGMKQDNQMVWVPYLDWLAKVMMSEHGPDLQPGELQRIARELDGVIIAAFNDLVDAATAH